MSYLDLATLYIYMGSTVLMTKNDSVVGGQ